MICKGSSELKKSSFKKLLRILYIEDTNSISCLGDFSDRMLNLVFTCNNGCHVSYYLCIFIVFNHMPYVVH